MTAADFQRLYEQGREARAAGAYERAAELLKRALERQPDNADVMLLLGTTYAFQQDWARAERILDQAVDVAPDYAAPRIALARTHFWQGENAAAKRLLAPLLRAGDAQPDALILAGRLALAQDKPARAQTLLERARTRRPRDADLLIALGDARAALGADAGARSAYERALDVEPGNERARVRLQAGRDPAWRIDVASRYSALSGAFDDWVTAETTLSRELAPRGTLSASVLREDRGYDIDSQVGLSYARPVGTDARVRASGTVAPGADFRARWRTGLGAERRIATPADGHLGETWVLGDATLADYTDTTTVGLQPGLRQSLADGRIRVAARLLALHDRREGWLAGWSVRADLEPTERLSLFVGGGVAPEAEATGDEAVRTVDTTSVFLGARFSVTPRTSLTASIARNDREDSYTRDVFGLGLTLRW